jgi:hypothetical protein
MRRFIPIHRELSGYGEIGATVFIGGHQMTSHFRKTSGRFASLTRSGLSSASPGRKSAIVLSMCVNS